MTKARINMELGTARTKFREWDRSQDWSTDNPPDGMLLKFLIKALLGMDHPAVIFVDNDGWIQVKDGRTNCTDVFEFGPLLKLIRMISDLGRRLKMTDGEFKAVIDNIPKALSIDDSNHHVRNMIRWLTMWMYEEKFV